MPGFSPPSTPREKAIAYIAACEHPGADALEIRLVRLARHWLRMIDSPRTTQASVDMLLDEITRDDQPEGGMQWERLQRDILAWARAEDWLEDGLPPTT